MDSIEQQILNMFPPSEQGNSSLRALARRADSLFAAETLRTREDAFVSLFVWLRESDHHMVAPLPREANSSPWSAASWKRERTWVSVLEQSADLLDRYRGVISSILEGTDGVSLFAESGLPSDRGLLAELADRTFNVLLPEPREEADLARLFLRLFPTPREVDRFFNLPPDLADHIVLTIAPTPEDPAWNRAVEWLLDAFSLLGARVQGLGLSEKLRRRGYRLRVQVSAFYRLTRSGDALVDAIRSGREVPAAASAWKANVSECRAELAVVVHHLESSGVNLDIVYALDVIEKSLVRMEIIAGVLVAQPGLPKLVTARRLMREVIRGRIADRSIPSLVHNSFRLLSRKIVEWAGKTGEHYITSGRDEYWQMWKAALGGGLLTVGTAAIKMMVTHHGLPPFVEGFLAGLNYAVSFVLMQIFHLALATKQPSMTGAALARIIERYRLTSEPAEFVEYVTRIVRSQLAAALGNIVAVGAGCVVFTLAWFWLFGGPYLDAELADYAVKSMNPLRSGTIIYAALTGVILWLSSLAGGWIENWALYHQLPRAIQEHRIGAFFHPDTLQRVSSYFSRNVSAWGGSIVLGFMLGMTPSFGRFFGIPLDVRHVTLSTGTLALGITSRGAEVIGRGALLMAALGIAFTFVLNLGVSFTLALRLALRARDVTRQDHLEIGRTLWRHFLACPGDFFFPPKRDAAEPAPELPPA